MGRNSAIKRFDARTAGQPLELFPERRARLPIIVELLASPWIVRASDLSRHPESAGARHVHERVDVQWDPVSRSPRAFVRAGRRYRIDAVLQSWATERAWWDPRRHVSARHWRVLARGGVYDLAFDHLRRSWRLTGIQD